MAILEEELMASLKKKTIKDIKTKECYICGKELGINNFWKDKYLKDGYTGYCKKCYKDRWINKKDKAQKGKRKYNNMCR